MSEGPPDLHPPDAPGADMVAPVPEPADGAVRAPAMDFLHPAEPDLDTPEEQARALLHDLRESFAPSYLTLISIIEGVLLGLTFELISEGRPVLRLGDPSALMVLNDVLLIAMVWNEYRMGSSMYRWVPSLPDAVIPFVMGGLQAALLLTPEAPRVWLALLGLFYLVAVPAYENMYRRAAEEARNEFVVRWNRSFRRFNPIACVSGSVVFWGLAAFHHLTRTDPGWSTFGLVTLFNIGFLVRGELNWRLVVGAARLLSVPDRPAHDGRLDAFVRDPRPSDGGGDRTSRQPRNDHGRPKPPSRRRFTRARRPDAAHAGPRPLPGRGRGSRPPAVPEGDPRTHSSRRLSGRLRGLPPPLPGPGTRRALQHPPFRVGQGGRAAAGGGGTRLLPGGRHVGGAPSRGRT